MTNIYYKRSLSCGGVELGVYRNTTLQNAMRRARRLSRHETSRTKNKFHDVEIHGETGESFFTYITYNNGKQISKKTVDRYKERYPNHG